MRASERGPGKEATRKRIFVDNPAELFGFPPAGA